MGTPKSETTSQIMSQTMSETMSQIINHMNIMVQGGDGGTPKCIDKSKLCDGKRDCQDGADEKNACCKYFNLYHNCKFVTISFSTFWQLYGML